MSAHSAFPTISNASAYLAKNIAKRVEVLDTELNLAKVMRGVEHMTDLVLTQIKDVLDAFARRDVAKALAVWRGDEEIDAVNNSLFRELFAYMMEDPRNISVCIHLLFVAKNIERMGDHATNIARRSITWWKAARCRTNARRATPPAPPTCRTEPDPLRPSTRGTDVGPHPDCRGRGTL